MVSIRFLFREKHHGEEVENQDGAGVHHQLHREQEFRVKGDVQAGHVEKHDQQGECAIDRISERNHQDGGQSDHAGKISEKHIRHETIS
jgi:hypothetical protein